MMRWRYRHASSYLRAETTCQVVRVALSQHATAMWASMSDEQRRLRRMSQSAGRKAITKLKRAGCALYILQTATGNTLTYPGFERELTAGDLHDILETSEVCLTKCALLMMLYMPSVTYPLIVYSGALIICAVK